MLNPRLLFNRSFALLTAGTFLSNLGDVVAGVGYLFAAYQLTGSRSQTTGVAIAEVLPYLLFGLVGGALSGLLPRLRVMIVTDLLRAAVQIGTTVLAVSGALSYPALLTVVFLIQVGGCVFTPCSRTVVVELTTEEQLVSANSVISLCGNVAAVLGPLVAAVLTSSGVALFFALDAASFVISAVLLVVVSRAHPAPAHENPDLVSARAKITRIPAMIGEFFTFAWRDRPLIALLVSTFLAVLAATWAREVGLFFKLVPQPDSDKSFYTQMLSLAAATGIGASLLLPLLARRFSLGHYALGVVIWGAGLTGLALSNDPAAVAGAVITAGLGLSLLSQARVYLLQTRLPTALIGQGFASAAVLLYAANAISLAGFGALSAHASVTTLILTSGLLLLAVAAGVAIYAHPHSRAARPSASPPVNHVRAAP